MVEALKIDRQRERKRAHEAAASSRRRDMGPVRSIANVRRRGRCRNDLARFCRTYNPMAFRLPWCEDHHAAIRRIEEAATTGALYAFAMPRGSGKSTIARHAALWAVSYGWCRYVLVIGANQEKANEAIDAIKKVIRFLPLYAEDFPEIVQAVQHLAGIANRATGQTCEDEPTMIQWGKEQVVLPTVPPPSNWPRSWALREDNRAPTSGAIISAAGLTSDGLRGSVITLTTGEFLRPDLILLDDPGTPEASASPTQTEKREQLVAADLLGMAAPDKPISAVMPCTVICPDDMADRLLDPAKYPLWRGQRSGILRSMPKNLDAWEKYREVWSRCAGNTPPDYTEANAYYKEHRAVLDEGAVPSWPERKYEHEISAIQHAMHRYLRNKRAFWSEDMNQPLPLEEPAAGELTKAALLARLNHQPRGLVPDWASKLTAAIDVQHSLLFWAVCGWGDGFTGSVVDYGAWPDQRRAYFGLHDARPTIAQATGVGSLEGSVWAALGALTAALLGREWQTTGGAALRVERCLVDARDGQLTHLIKKFCKENAFASLILPCEGLGFSAVRKPMETWKPRPGERHGHGWMMPVPERGKGRSLLFDANLRKTFLAERLRQPLGEPGAFTLFGSEPEAHRMLADHLCSEYPTEHAVGAWKTVQWVRRPNQENHLLDTLSMSCTAASERGCALQQMQRAAKGGGAPKKTMAQWQAERRAGR